MNFTINAVARALCSRRSVIAQTTAFYILFFAPTKWDTVLSTRNFKLIKFES